VTDTRTPEEKEATAEMMTEIIKLRRVRTEFTEIGVLMARKYRADPDKPYTKQWMHELYARALERVPALEVQQYRAEQIELVDELMREALTIMRRDHLAVSQGRVVRMGTVYTDDDGKEKLVDGVGEPVLDDAPKLAAIAEVRKLLERMARILGTDTPVKQELDLGGTLNYKINGVDVKKHLQ
jgi:hypothetical protein